MLNGEIIILKITKSSFEELYNNGLIDLKSGEYEINRVEVIDPEYSKDERWKKLKEASNKAYKELKDYEFFLRHEKQRGNITGA